MGSGLWLAALCAPNDLHIAASFGRPEVMRDAQPSAYDTAKSPDLDNVFPIDLATALRLAGTNNLDITRARELAIQSRLQMQRARMLILPTLAMGSTYYRHDGNIAKTEGNIIKANKDALFVGLGPSAVISFSDALLVPLVARQVNRATRAGAERVHNETLLAVAESYFAVLRARRRLARADVALELLTAEQGTPLRAGSKGLLPVVDSMQKAGVAEALLAEVYRVQIEVLRRREERAAAFADFRVAVAELARLVRLDPATPLWPMEDYRFAIQWQAPWTSDPLDAQIERALTNRPDLVEGQFQVQAAMARVRAARLRPYVPNLVVNYSWGGFGGGPDPDPKGGFQSSGKILHFDTRQDFDVGLIWRLQNLGLGNRVEVREQQSLERQATMRQIQLQDQVVAQVVQANELIKGWNDRVTIIRSALFDPSGKPGGPAFEALRQNFLRLREEPKTRPLEVLDSIRSLSDFLEAYGQALTDYERSQFRLMIALGLPPEQIVQAVSCQQ